MKSALWFDSIQDVVSVVSTAHGGTMRRVFISFQMEDKKQVDGVRLLKWNKGYPLEFYDESVRIAYKSDDASYIRRNIRKKISRCSATVCFLGSTTYLSDWVNWELETSIDQGNDILLMGLPNGPQRLHLPPVVTGKQWWLWDPKLLSEFTV
ncbi:TIR domain-containing protein [Phaeobacter inhibens]|uniref:TIR domain-containing protein n=1 Tax=Phaeobacter inhibens TaxID=221822 RepID=UPI0021A868C6|nr:TIR domain-containing protein [Phaeobacter inhibens]UWR63461.1 TIR domain-containing protein [Phaeobacter inhibens]